MEIIVNLIYARAVGSGDDVDMLPVALVVADVVVERVEEPVLNHEAAVGVDERMCVDGWLGPQRAVGSGAELTVG